MKMLTTVLSAFKREPKLQSLDKKEVDKLLVTSPPKTTCESIKIKDRKEDPYWNAEINGISLISLTVDELLPYASQGNISALLLIADCYESGIGVVNDPVESVRWIQKAVLLGSLEAQEKLRLFLGVAGIDTLTILVNAGIEDAEVPLAEAIEVACDNLTGVNARAVVSLYERALGRGCDRAAVGLAWLYLVGRGVPEDVEEAVRLACIALQSSDKDIRTRAQRILASPLVKK